MGQSIKPDEITKQVLVHQYQSQYKQSMSLKKSVGGVSLQEQDIALIRDLIIKLLNGTKKLSFSNKNKRKNNDQPIVILTVNINGFRLMIKKSSLKWDYILNLEKNSLLLNDTPATEMDAQHFKTSLNKVFSRILLDNYEVIQNE